MENVLAMTGQRQPTGRNAVFGRLSDEPLGLIASMLPFADRLAFLSCCKATRAFHKTQRQRQTSEGIQVLWPELCVRLTEAGKAAQFASWLDLEKTQLSVLHLDYSSVQAPTSAAAREPASAQAQPVHDSSALLSELAGSSVRSLTITESQVYVGGWPHAIPHLQSLSVRSQHMEVGPGLSKLSALTSLELVGRPGWTESGLPADLLPPSLRALKLGNLHAAALAGVDMPAGGLPQLQSLVLSSEPYKAMEPRWLAADSCPQLTQLHLEGCQLPSLPAELAALTGLVDLKIKNSRLFEEHGSAEALLPLSALQQLTRLELGSYLLSSLPAAVLSLPALQELDISHNDIQASLPFNSSTITRLVLDDDALLASVKQLTGLAALRSLHVVETGTGFGFNRVCVLLASLAAIPSFETLSVPWGYQDTKSFSMARRLLEAMNVKKFDIIT